MRMRTTEGSTPEHPREVDVVREARLAGDPGDEAPAAALANEARALGREDLGRWDSLLFHVEITESIIRADALGLGKGNGFRQSRNFARVG